MAKAKKAEATNRRGYWAEQIAKAKQTYQHFHSGGDIVVDRYRIEKANSGAPDIGKDRFNILYSSTETVRPSLYAQTPKVEGKLRHRDRKNPVARNAVTILENCTSYAIEDLDFDDVVENCIEDYLLPGLGQAWVRYEPTFKQATDASGKPQIDEKNEAVEILDFEAIGVDYVHWKDYLTGVCRVWKEVPWQARRVYTNKAKATKRFGKEVAGKLTYNYSKVDERNQTDKQAEIWEIWHIESKQVIWFSEGYADDVLDVRDDPLRLKGFWPCPRPMRAISNTRTFVPRPFYSQYQAQAEELNNLTLRIRLLTQALKVRGLYDGSQSELEQLLSEHGGNKMIAVQGWQAFVQGGGVVGSVQWLPLKEIVATLMELLKAREQVKNEIYEITGFSDIVRGVSKASETLGAQNIKNNWASARLKKMQKEVQRFVRDVIRLMAEIIAEHFTDESLAVYSGFELPPPLTPEAMQAAQAAGQPIVDPRQQAIAAFKAAVDLLRKEKDRCAQIGIETDSTILPDEESERKDRMEFLANAGAYMQQAGPMIQQYPEMRGVLLGTLMFVVRTFRAARPLEQAFEEFQEKIANMPPSNPDGEGKGDDGAAKAQAAVQTATIKADTEKQKALGEGELRRYEIDQETALKREAENNRHTEKMAELKLREREVTVKEAELGIKQQDADTRENSAQASAAVAVAQHQHQRDVADDNAQRSDEQFEAQRQDAKAERERGENGS